MGRITRSFAVTKVTVAEAGHGTTIDTRADLVSVEEPLELRVNGTTYTTTMRTPGDDIAWAHGFLLSEGVILSAEDVRSARYCAGATTPGGENSYNVLNLELAHPTTVPLAETRRLTTTTSACGVCGTASIDAILKAHPTNLRVARVDPEFVLAAPRALRAHQKSFRKTGGIHAAGVMDSSGEVLVSAEDIGRHNAADKVIGKLLQQGRLPATDLWLVMTSRASYELVQKAVVAGFAGLIAVSAATSLAVELARQANLALAGFVRGDRFNLYSGELLRPTESPNT